MALLQKLTSVGQIQLERGNLRKAKTAFEYAYKEAKLCDSTEYQKCSLMKLSSTYMAARKPECAVTCLRVALDLEVPCVKQGLIHLELANAYEMLNKCSEALNHYDLALAAYTIHGEDGFPEAVANTAIKSGMLSMKLEKYKKAIEKFNISTRILSEKEMVIQLAVVLCMKAQCLVRSNGTVAEAIDVCEECMKLCKSVAPDFFVVNLYNELGLILTQSKQYERSCECYRLSLETVDELEEGVIPLVKQAALMQNMGAVLNSVGKYKEATSYSKRAADIYGSTGVRSSQCHCFLNIAFGYSQLATVSDIDNSEEYYLHALLAAKDTGSLRDQWQALEGLAGIALSKRQMEKAVEYYQKAVGICAAVGSNTYEQDRLVRKLSAALSSKIPFISAELVSVARGKQVGLLTPTSALNSPNNSLLLGTYNSILPQNHRPLSTDALRVAFHTEAANTSAPASSRKKKRKRTRKLSRRPDQDIHPVHGAHPLVHHGLGSYKSWEDQASNFLSPQNIGRRRHNSGDGASIVSVLHIKGLAVTLDDPTEPSVGSGAARGGDMDEIDSAGIIRVRPMSGRVVHRRSTIVDTDYIDGSSDSETAEQDSDLADEFDGSQVVTTPEPEISDSADMDDGQYRRRPIRVDTPQTRNHSNSSDHESESVPRKLTNKKNYRSVRRCRDGAEQDYTSTAAENQLYGSIIDGKCDDDGGMEGSSDLVTSVELRPTTPPQDKGKGPMAAKIHLKKMVDTAHKFSEYATHRSLSRTQRAPLLETELATDSEDDHRAVRDHMRQLSNMDSAESETDIDEREEQTQHLKKSSSSSGSSGSSGSSSEDEANNSFNKLTAPKTYDRQLSGASVSNSVIGGNFFKSSIHTALKKVDDPIYESIPHAENSVPVHNAPPPLPERNYSPSHSDEESPANVNNTSDRDSPDVGVMTRGERDQFLSVKQHTRSPKVVKWEKPEAENNPSKQKTKSRMCIVM